MRMPSQILIPNFLKVLRDDGKHSSRLRLLTGNAIVALLYFSAGEASLHLALPPALVAPIGPSAGIALAAVWFLGLRITVGIFLGSLLLNAATLYLSAESFSFQVFFMASGIALAQTLQALVGGFWLRRTVVRHICFQKVGEVLKFTYISLVSCLIAASLGTAALFASGLIGIHEVLPNGMMWWAGDIIGLFLVTPLITVWFTSCTWPLDRKKVREVLLFYVLFFSVTAGLVLSFAPVITSGYFLAYLYIPFAMWAVFRQGAQGLTFFSCLAGMTAIGAILFIPGFAKITSPENFFQFQLLISGIALLGLILAAAIREKKVALSTLNLALQTASMGIWEWEIATGKVSWSPSLEKAYGLTPGTSGGNFDDLKNRIHPADRGYVMRAIQETLSNGAVYHLEYRVVQDNGDIKRFETHGRLYYDAAGKPLGMMGVALDITKPKRSKEIENQLIEDLQKAQHKIRQANQSLENTVKERTALAEKRAAELRKLASALTLAEQKERRRLAQILHDHLQQMLVAAKMGIVRLKKDCREARMAQNIFQVQDLLDQAIAASRSLTIELSPPVLHDAGLAPALEWLGRWFKEKHELNVELLTEPDLKMPTEDLKIFLFQAVRELLLNVVKHADVGRAVIRLSAEGSELCVTVEDQGRGFDLEKIAGQEFKGFGLMNVRERLELLGGRMELLSVPGQGAQFRLYVPATMPMRKAIEFKGHKQENKIKRDLKMIRILVADDHTILRQGLINMFDGKRGFKVVGEANDGEEALRKVEELLPDVVIMDISMPRMNGIEATERIKARFPEIQVIVLSLHDTEDMANTMRRVGASAYLSKSGPTDKLMETIRSVLEPHREGPKLQGALFQ